MRGYLEILAEAMPRRLVLLDIGARGGLQRPWNEMTRLLTSVLVEPDPEEVVRLREQGTEPEQIVVPHALWRTDAELTLHLTAARGCSSVLSPNSELLEHFPDSKRFVIERDIVLQACTVDDLCMNGKMPRIDFAKIDTQGSELAILEGARETFRRELVGLEVEVEFAPMYVNQPLFSDVERFVREEIGLGVWDVRKTYWKHQSGTQYGPPKGRLIFGDALFMRSLETVPSWIESLGPEIAAEKVIMSVAAALAYGYADYAMALLILPAVKMVLTANQQSTLCAVIEATGTGFRPWRYGQSALYILFDTIAQAVKPSHDGWATIGQPLGSRKRGVFWT